MTTDVQANDGAGVSDKVVAELFDQNGRLKQRNTNIDGVITIEKFPEEVKQL